MHLRKTAETASGAVDPEDTFPAEEQRDSGWPSFVREHRLFLLLVLVGLGLRILTTAAYAPALLRVDSVGYLRNSQALEPFSFHPIGYPAFLRLFPVDTSLAFVTAAQHALGLGTAALLYVVLRRLMVRTWLAALATTPVLLDAYQLNIEQFILSETLFGLLLVAAGAAVLWNRPPRLPAAALAGLILAAAALTRTVALVLVLPLALAALFASSPEPLRRRAAVTAVLVLSFAAPVIAYAAWFGSHHGEVGLTTAGGRILYGRVVEIADCDGVAVPASERPLCVEGAAGDRPTANQLMWYRRHSPFFDLDPTAGRSPNEVGASFARRIIRERPLAYARVVGSDVLQAFAPTKVERYDDVPLERWKFPHRYRVLRPGLDWSEAPSVGSEEAYESRRSDSAAASFLRVYQRFGYVPGTVLGLALLAGLSAALGFGRSKRSGLRVPAFLFASLSVTLLVAVAATTIFNWRYQLPHLVLLPPAGAVGVAALFDLRRGHRAS